MVGRGEGVGMVLCHPVEDRVGILVALGGTKKIGELLGDVQLLLRVDPAGEIGLLGTVEIVGGELSVQ